MKSISLILCLLFCYQAFAKKPVDHGRVLENVDFKGVTTFTPKSDLGLNEAPNGFKNYDELFKKNKLSELVDLFKKNRSSLGVLDNEAAADYVVAFTEILSISKFEGQFLENKVLAEYLKAYSDLAELLNLEKEVLNLSYFESLDKYGKLNELHRLFEDLSYRIPEDNL